MWSSHPKKQNHIASKGDDDLYRELWKAFAGQSMDVPRVGEQVYYFPGLHIKQLEQSLIQELNQGTPILDPYLKILCHAVHVRFLVENISEEIYAEINLLPKQDQTEPVNPDFYHSKIPRPQIHSFCKVLTASDTKSNWGLSIPQKDAVKCFPPLDMSRDKPIQELVVKDLSGKEWRFKHVFGGHPRRHLLTNGWSAFVNSKKLVSGDLVVFLRREENGDVHVGFRHLLCQKSSVEAPIASSLDIKGVLAVASDALASQRPFSVYCKPQTSQFIISLNKYLEAINLGLGVSMTFKMPSEIANSHGSFTCMANEKDQMQINQYSQNANVFLNEDEEHMEDAEAIVYSPPRHSTTPSEIGEKRHSDHTIYISPVEGNVESTYEGGTRKHNEVSNPVEIESIRGTEEHKEITTSSWNFNPIQEQELEDAEIIKDILPIVSQNLPLDYTVPSNTDNDQFLPIMQDSEEWQNFQGTDFPLHVQPPSGNSSKSMHPTSISSHIPCDGPSHADEKVHWEGYHVARHYIPILSRIISQYPSTLSSFKATSPIFQSMCLEILAELVYLLGQFTTANMDIKYLSEAKRYLRDLKLSGIEIGWLEKRLAKVEDIFTMKRISIRRQELVLGIEDTTATLRLMNEELGSLDMELQKLSSNINLKTPAEERPILDGLL
ncbi:uncharacterized protein [Nicotiana tomentosiformis]|uniref:uncharacterized protein isoform X1 n=1 Tax=Nicotiana tomentosiformis TaxID=4098 RepID=UPI00051BFC7D|nr:uncharacterized protein LOC104116082 isoform X1 [Nicotiana tomentosiformis]